MLRADRKKSHSPRRDGFVYPGGGSVAVFNPRLESFGAGGPGPGGVGGFRPLRLRWVSRGDPVRRPRGRAAGGGLPKWVSV